MTETKVPKKAKDDKVTIESLKRLEDQKAADFREPVVTGTGKKKKVTPSETG